MWDCLFHLARALKIHPFCGIYKNSFPLKAQLYCTVCCIHYFCIFVTEYVTNKLKEGFSFGSEFKSIVTWPHVLGQNIVVAGVCGGELLPDHSPLY